MRIRSPLIPIFLIVSVDVLGLTLMLPLLPFYAEHFGASAFQVGLLFATYALCQFISGPILGRTSDQVGRRPTLLVSQMGTFVGFILFGLAGSLWMLFVARIIDGITAGNLSIAQAYISDVTKPEERTKAFGLIGIAFGLGFMLGPAISGFLSRFGYQWPPFAAAALSFTSIIFTWRLLPAGTRRPVAPSPAGRIALITYYFRRPETRQRMLEFLCFGLSFSTLIGGLALFLERRLGFNAEQAGYVFAASGVVGAIVQGGLIGRIVKALGEERLSRLGFSAMFIGNAMVGFITSIPMLGPAIVISGFGSSVTRPSITTLITRSVGRDEQGAALGVSQSLNSIAMMVGPLIATRLIQYGHLEAYGLTSGGFALLGVVFAMFGAARARREHELGGAIGPHE